MFGRVGDRKYFLVIVEFFIFIIKVFWRVKLFLRGLVLFNKF